ncbi:MAG: IclR family transcriptional regulator [Clostridiales bacterium]|nr:IclR family transcriptional regulator [Clostridiales bacterium]
MENKNPIQVADRLFQVLETLAETGPLPLTDLSRRLSLNKSTIHRLLTSLICLGYVKQDDDTGKYGLSFKILSLSNRFLDQMDILDTVRPMLRQISKQTGETVHFVQLDGLEAVYICKEESTQNSVRMVSKVGSRIPLYCSGVGKAMMADMSPDKIAAIWKKSEKKALTSHTITNYEDFLSCLTEVRRNGYALDNEENELGVRCIAVSLPDFSGSSCYAVSISAPVTRMSDERILELGDILLKIKADFHR